MAHNCKMLYLYTIPIDDGAAPNPYWNICTLAICKPVIRRTAQIGDWFVGLGSKKSPLGDISNKIVYLMRVTNKMSMKEYDIHCKKYLPNKIPDIYHKDYRLHVGDCIYDFSMSSVVNLRTSVHTNENRKTDLGGCYVLLSEQFYYFGDSPTELPSKFHSIIKSNQGHKSNSNEKIMTSFIE